MIEQAVGAWQPKTFVRRHSVSAYFLLTFAISWTGALAVAAPALLRGLEVSKLSGILMFPAMLLGPSVSGIVMTRIVSGKEGTKDLFAGMRRVRVPARWFGILFGVPAGFLEEIGWTGYAFPQMSAKRNPLAAAIVLGVFWGIWHFPVINFLGAASPHGAYWLQFFLAFTLAMTAMRALIAWLYVNTRSVMLAQIMHVSSTGALVIFSPQVRAGQEAMWYAVYGCVLWVVVGVIAGKWGRGLTR